MTIVWCIQFGVYANFTNNSSIFQTLGPQYNVLQVKSDSLLGVCYTAALTGVL